MSSPTLRVIWAKPTHQLTMVLLLLANLPTGLAQAAELNPSVAG